MILCWSPRLRPFTPSYQGKPFCGCWVHNAFVNVDGEKMSKSKGNFLTLKSTLKTAVDVRAFRYLVVSSQYRTNLSFSGTSLDGARNTVQRLDKLRVSEALCDSLALGWFRIGLLTFV